mmetsp:Transcript_26359/g.83470  ORF Transcript_26359/g.83470 Transcript_26359/m.83470 type:complete len:214 (+) Transcript_26359:864-1505(+)
MTQSCRSWFCSRDLRRFRLIRKSRCRCSERQSRRAAPNTPWMWRCAETRDAAVDMYDMAQVVDTPCSPLLLKASSSAEKFPRMNSSCARILSRERYVNSRNIEQLRVLFRPVSIWLSHSARCASTESTRASAIMQTGRCFSAVTTPTMASSNTTQAARAAWGAQQPALALGGQGRSDIAVFVANLEFHRQRNRPGRSLRPREVPARSPISGPP